MNRHILHLIIILFIFLCSYSCYNSNHNKPIVLLADREAPLGWIYLKMYEDHSFEFISKGLRSEAVYPGTYKITYDTIYFTYSDSIPKAGKTAIIGKKSISYIDGDYLETVEIKLNTLRKLENQ